MKLNVDCIRDILLTVEDIATIYTKVYFNPNTQSQDSNYERVKKYSYDVLVYHIKQCAMCDYFTYCETDGRQNFLVEDLTPKAHEFIANIRETNNWNKTKKALAHLGTYSLGIVAQVALSVIQKDMLQFFSQSNG